MGAAERRGASLAAVRDGRARDTLSGNTMLDDVAIAMEPRG